MEIRADVLLKGTKVDGVYSTDPMKDKKAKLFKTIKYINVLNKNLRIMDSTAISLCMENNLPIVVFNMNTPGNLSKLIEGKFIGTTIR